MENKYRAIVDTETIGLDKPFCYDVGYIIIDILTGAVAVAKHFVVEQVWHNLPLFESAYYKDKRPQYVQLMRAKQIRTNKWGYIMQEMIRDFKTYNITDAYAYNSKFDDKVFTFNCDWFKCNNPFDTVAIHDIWGYASQFVTNNDDYKTFCEEHEQFTDTGNYKGSAESVYRYLTGEIEFEEKHMGLCDSEIETAILLYCIDNGAEWDKDYKVNNVLPRLQKKPFTIKINGEEIYKGEYFKKYCRNDMYSFTVTL